MRALCFLLTRRLKNSIVSIFKNPSQLIGALVLIFFVFFTAFSASATQVSSSHLRDVNELYALIFLLYSFVFVMISKNGFYSGGSMFTMTDVNLIFTAPLSQSKVLSFGLFQQLGKSLLIGYFILYQSSLVKTTYGQGFQVLIYILLGYGITVFLSQMTAMVIYSFTSASDRRRSVTKAIYYTVIAAFAVYALGFCYKNAGVSPESLVLAARSTVARLFPVSGILSLAVEGAAKGEIIKIAAGLIYCVLFWGLYRVLLHFINSDYYEDVLQSAEASFSAIQARKEGKASESAPRNVKVGKTGITKGMGASVIAYKHQIENRRSKVFLLSTTSLVSVIFTVVGCFIFRDMPLGIFIISAYIMIMTVGMGRWAKELNYPYIYLIPEPSYKKLYYTVKSEIPSLVTESVICFIPVYFIVGISLAEAAAMALGRITIGLLLISVNLLIQRIFGTSQKKVFILTLYFLMVMLSVIPGAVAGAVIATLFPFLYFVGYIAMAIVNLILAIIIGFCCRNVFEYV